MCENPDITSKTAMRRLEERLLMDTQRGSGELRVDDSHAYFMGKAIPKEAWRVQALKMGLPADMYLDIAALAKDDVGRHAVNYKGRTYLVEVNGAVQSEHGLHREIISIIPYQGQN